MFKKTEDSRYIYQNKFKALIKLYLKFVFDMEWLMLILKISLDKQLLIKYCVIKHLLLLKIQNMMHIKENFLQCSIKFFDKKLLAVVLKSENICNNELVEELHKPIIRKFKTRKVQSPFIDNIWGADLADMQLISKFNKGICFLLCVIDIYSKYAWAIHLKFKKGITVTNAFQKILKECNRK